MKPTLLKSKFSKTHFTIVAIISAMFLFMNITGCALSRQFIRANTGHGYGSGFANTSSSNEWDFLEHNGSGDEGIIDASNNSYQQTECLVDITPGDVVPTGNDLSNMAVRAYPAPVWPRGIYTTGTGIVIVVDLYK
jgi:hypothetical protein